jgi:sugar lactone lactonase YvrE
MSAGYIGQNPIQNIFQKPGIWHSKEQYLLKTTGDWDPEFVNYDIKYAFLKDAIETTDSINTNTYDLYYPNLVYIEGIAFSSDGFRMYVAEQGTIDGIIQYQLTAAFNISAIDYSKTKVRKLYDVGMKNVTGLKFKSDGTSMYVCDYHNAHVVQYDLSRAWDIDTALPAGKAFAFVQNSPFATLDIAFGSNGTKLYAIQDYTNLVYQYTLGTAWDISTTTYDNLTLDVSASGSEDYPGAAGIDLSPDGTKLYTVGNRNQTIRQFTLSTPWSLSGASTTPAATYSIGAIEGTPRCMFVKSTGDQYFIGGQVRIHEFFMPSSGNISLSTYSTSIRTGTEDGTALSMYIGPEGDGTRLWVHDLQIPAIREFKLTTPWDTSTGYYNGNFLDLNRYYTPGNGFRSFTFRPDGTRLYAVGLANSVAVYQFNLTVPWDVSAVGTAVSFSNLGVETAPEDIRFRPDGTKMFIVGRTTDTVRQFTLSTAWDVTTATLASGVTTSVFVDPLSCEFSGDGMMLYIGSDNRLTEYRLSSAWDVGAGQSTGISISALVGGNYGWVFADGGKRLYCTTFNDDRIREFDLIKNKSLINRKRIS